MKGATACTALFLAGLGCLVGAAWCAGLAAGLAATGAVAVLVSGLTYRSLQQQKEHTTDGT